MPTKEEDDPFLRLNKRGLPHSWSLCCKEIPTSVQTEIYKEFGFFVLTLCIKKILNFECIAKLDIVETAKLLILSTRQTMKKLPKVAEIRHFNLFGPYSSKDDLFIKIALDYHTMKTVT